MLMLAIVVTGAISAVRVLLDTMVTSLLRRLNVPRVKPNSRFTVILESRTTESVVLVLFIHKWAKFSPPNPPSLFLAAEAGAAMVDIAVPLPLKFAGPSKVTFLSL